MLLPVGSYTKPQIRELATELSLGVADKRDSQEICFVVTGKHDEFIRERRGHSDMSGEIVTTDGTLVGTHPGIEGFTVGQRKGLGVAMGEPHFVIRIEAESRRVVIGTRNELARRELTAKNSNWLIEPPDCSFPCLAQIRYNSKAEPATVHLVDNNSFQVEFDSAQHGVAPGQAVVCYQNDHVLGGGWIE